MRKEYVAPELNVLSFTANAPVATWDNIVPDWSITTSMDFKDPWDTTPEE